MPSIVQIEKLKVKNDIELEKAVNKTHSCLKKYEQLEHRKILAENEEKERNRKAKLPWLPPHIFRVVKSQMNMTE